MKIRKERDCVFCVYVCVTVAWLFTFSAPSVLLCPVSPAPAGGGLFDESDAEDEYIEVAADTEAAKVSRILLPKTGQTTAWLARHIMSSHCASPRLTALLCCSCSVSTDVTSRHFTALFLSLSSAPTAPQDGAVNVWRRRARGRQ